MAYTALTGGPLSENCYVLFDEVSGEAAVIDPGFMDARLADAIEPLNVKYILLTHGHFDHIWCAEELRAETGAEICTYKTEKALAENPMLNASMGFLRDPVTCTVDRVFEDGEAFTVGELSVKVLHTPGHTAGGCCYITDEAVFTGDTLMGYSIGRCDLPTGDDRALMASLKTLASLPGDPDICGGHGPVTKLSAEKQRNPYL